MSALAQQQRSHAGKRDLQAPAGASAPSALYLQRSGVGPAAFVSGVESTLASGGSGLAPDVRADMESRFQRDFSGVRVHDDARAHDSARQAQAAAYTVGDHVVFGAGRYDPVSGSGRHLLAHELAHTIQQAGMQYQRLEGMALDDHAGLEREADRAADAAMGGAVPAPLSVVGLPRLSRAPDNEPFPEQDDPDATAAVQKAGLAFVDRISKSRLGKGSAIGVVVKTPLPVLPKGDGKWVKTLWDDYAKGGNLVFKAEVGGRKLPAIKEASGKDYRGVWLNRYGFKDLKELGVSISKWLASPKGLAETTLRDGLDLAAKNFAANKLGGSQEANIDHIVEKQVGGASIPENMQIINAAENQKSGIQLNAYIVGQANQVLEALGGKGISFIRIRYASVDYTPSTKTDAYDRIEGLLQAKELKPEPEGVIATEQSGKPLTLQSGNATARIYVPERSGKDGVAIAGGGVNDSARLLISGLDLLSYKRATGGKKGATNDQVSAIVDAARLHNAVRRAAGKGAQDAVLLDALPGAALAEAGGETRQLKISSKTKEMDFFFPYLSPGKFTKLELAADNSFAADGYIEPSVKFLKRIDVSLAKNSFIVKGTLGADRFQAPFKGFKVTESSLNLQLAPDFKPSGTFKFQIGPEQKPYLTGEAQAGLDAAGLMVTGDLKGKNIPGVDDATGKVRYSASEGWSGELKASKSKLPRTKKAEVTFGFRTAGGATQFYAGGLIQLDVGTGKDLTIEAAYRDDRMVYSGALLWEKPIKMVDQVRLAFTYDGDLLEGTGSSDIVYKSKFTGKITVYYRKKGDEEARLSGKGNVALKAGKADGSLDLSVSHTGVISGTGKVSYAFSDKIKPTVGVTLHPDGHLTLAGKIEITQPIQLFPEFPKGGAERDLIKVKMDFIIPGPFPGLADPMVHLGAGVRFSYGIGPGQIINTVIEGEFDPLEENKNVKLKFTSTFEVPGHVGLTGILEAGLGIAVLGGLAAKAHAGLRIEPGFTLKLTTRAPVTAEYENGDFAFEGRLEMQGGLSLGLAIKLYAHVEAIGGALEKDFTYDVKDYTFDAGQQMTLTLAKIGYSTRTGFRAPSLDDIKISPGNLDPIEMIRKVAHSAKGAMAGQG